MKILFFGQLFFDFMLGIMAILSNYFGSLLPTSKAKFSAFLRVSTVQQNFSEKTKIFEYYSIRNFQAFVRNNICKGIIWVALHRFFKAQPFAFLKLFAIINMSTKVSKIQ